MAIIWEPSGQHRDQRLGHEEVDVAGEGAEGEEATRIAITVRNSRMRSSISEAWPESRSLPVSRIGKRFPWCGAQGVTSQPPP